MTQIEAEMIRLQNMMEELRIREAEAFEQKQIAERTLDECRANWIEINKRYQDCKELYQASKK